jgi:replicative DNA helicase
MDETNMTSSDQTKVNVNDKTISNENDKTLTGENDKTRTNVKEKTISSSDEETILSPADEEEMGYTEELSMSMSEGSDDIMPHTDEMKGLLSDDDHEADDMNDSRAHEDTIDENISIDLNMKTKMTPGTKQEKIDQAASSQEKTMAVFSLSDITKKLEDEIANIPENYTEHIEPEQMSQVIKDHFRGRSQAEKVKINRNFLKDAEPLNIEKLAVEIKKSPEGLKTGYKDLDSLITIPPNAVTLITSLPGHGKTCFMLNLLANMCRMYTDKHFIYFTYEDAKWEIMLKLINICSTKQFNRKEDQQSNLERWKQEFKQTDIDTLKVKATNEVEYNGLKEFLEISPKIHVIDSGHTLPDLIDSIRSFNKAFDVGGVFIDSFQKIGMDKEKGNLGRRGQLQNISQHLRKAAREVHLPVIMSTQLTAGSKDSPEYDNLTDYNLKETGNPDHNASLVIGLQNYARSKYFGSNVNPDFKSTFYGQPLEKAKPMPDNFKDMMQKTILLTKVMSNKTGPEPEVELIFYKQLLKIGDFRKDA